MIFVEEIHGFLAFFYQDNFMRDSGTHLWEGRCKKGTVPHIEVISACVVIV